MRLAVKVVRMGDSRFAHTGLVGKSERKAHFPKRRWDNSVKWIFGKWDWSLEWINLAQNMDRLLALENTATGRTSYLAPTIVNNCT
jgi:hypothetical protein